jgi:Zn-dependent protease
MISIDDVGAEMDRRDRATRSTMQNLLLFAVSLAAFAATRVLNATWTSAVILIIVILVHECGHWLAMRSYGYRDLRMFFIPFFGAAVSGKPQVSSGKQSAIVSLMGPAPGIFVGVACGLLYLKWHQPLLFQYALTSLFLNGFNLLPIYPLDGGRFMEAVLFLRHPIVEVVFKALAAVALGALALRLSSIPMGLFAFFTAMLARESYYQGKIAQRLALDRGDQPVAQEERMPREELERALPVLPMGVPANRVTVKILAGRAVSVWRRIRQKSPSAGATAALMAAYFGIVAVMAVGAVTYGFMLRAAYSRSMLVYRAGADGKQMPMIQTFYRNTVTAEIQLDSEGFYDGPATMWTISGVKKEDGTWRKGYWQGDWRSYDRAGNIIAIKTYDNGRPVRLRSLKDGVLADMVPDQWPYLFKETVQTSPARAPERLRPKVMP